MMGLELGPQNKASPRGREEAGRRQGGGMEEAGRRQDNVQFRKQSPDQPAYL